jgi:hypothetical protein
VKESAEVINIVYIYTEQCYGMVDNLGIYASEVTYVKDGIDYREIIDNEDFIIMNEIVLTHIEE